MEPIRRSGRAVLRRVKWMQAREAGSIEPRSSVRRRRHSSTRVKRSRQRSERVNGGDLNASGVKQAFLCNQEELDERSTRAKAVRLGGRVLCVCRRARRGRSAGAAPQSPCATPATEAVTLRRTFRDNSSYGRTESAARCIWHRVLAQGARGHRPIRQSAALSLSFNPAALLS